MADDRPGEFLLTYAELGERLGVSPDGARTKAKRAGWPVILGNDGRARVRVISSELPKQGRRLPEQTGVTPDLLTELRRAEAERLAELLARAEKAEREAEQARAALGDLRARLARLEGEVAGVKATATAEVNAAARAAEEAIAARDELLAELRRSLEHERGRARRLEDALAETRRPWWRKLWGS